MNKAWQNKCAIGAVVHRPRPSNLYPEGAAEVPAVVGIAAKDPPCLKQLAQPLLDLILMFWGGDPEAMHSYKKQTRKNVHGKAFCTIVAPAQRHPKKNPTCFGVQPHPVGSQDGAVSIARLWDGGRKGCRPAKHVARAVLSKCQLSCNLVVLYSGLRYLAGSQYGFSSEIVNDIQQTTLRDNRNCQIWRSV